MQATAENLPTLKPNPNWAKLPLFNRKNWSRVRFDDVVENLNETCDPAEAGLERVIAMEHLEPGSLHIRAWGNVADGTTFTRRCRPGQVLFGKRRAYQRKVAVAEFDAVVSGDIYVLAPKGDRLLPELLPFLCLSERFFQHAVGTSAGSLSPRTNWSSLASFEFDLPPLDQQRRIAEILWAVDEVPQRWKACENQHAQSLYEFVSGLTLRGLKDGGMQTSPIGKIPNSWRCVRLEDVTVSSAYGPRFPGSQYTPDGNVRTIRTTDFGDFGEINFTGVPAATLDGDTISAHRLQTGDFLLSRSGQQAGLTAVFRGPDNGIAYVAGAFLIRYRLRPELNPDFLLALCQGRYGDKFVRALVQGGDQKNISGSDFSRLYIPVPSIEVQNEIVGSITSLRTTGLAIAKHRASSEVLLNSTLNTVL